MHKSSGSLLYLFLTAGSLTVLIAWGLVKGFNRRTAAVAARGILLAPIFFLILGVMVGSPIVRATNAESVVLIMIAILFPAISVLLGLVLADWLGSWWQNRGRGDIPRLRMR